MIRYPAAYIAQAMAMLRDHEAATGSRVVIATLGWRGVGREAVAPRVYAYTVKQPAYYYSSLPEISHGFIPAIDDNHCDAVVQDLPGLFASNTTPNPQIRDGAIYFSGTAGRIYGRVALGRPLIVDTALLEASGRLVGFSKSLAGSGLHVLGGIPLEHLQNNPPEPADPQMRLRCSALFSGLCHAKLAHTDGASLPSALSMHEPWSESSKALLEGDIRRGRGLLSRNRGGFVLNQHLYNGGLEVEACAVNAQQAGEVNAILSQGMRAVGSLVERAPGISSLSEAAVGVIVHGGILDPQGRSVTPSAPLGLAGRLFQQSIPLARPEEDDEFIL